MNTQRVNTAAGVIHAAMEQGRTLPASLAYALESAQLLQSPEAAAELKRLRDRVAQLEKQTDRVRTADLAPGDRVWVPGGIECLTVGQHPEKLPVNLWPTQPGMRVTGTTDSGEAMCFDAAQSKEWARDDATSELSRLRKRVAELETSARGCDGEGCVLPHSSWCTRAREFAAQHSGCTCGEPWKDTPQTHAGHCWLLSPPDDELEWHRNRVAELLARVAELEAANSSLIANRDAQIIAWLGKKAREYGTSNRENRAKAEAVARMADKLSRGAVRRPLEDPHDSPLHHDYRLGHDLPEMPHALQADRSVKPCAECPEPTPPGRAYCSTRCRNAGDRHDADDYLAEETSHDEL